MSKNITKERMRELKEGIHFTKDIDPDIYKTVEKDLAVEQGPAISIYLPIKHDDRDHGRDDWDRIEFKDLIKEAKEQVLKQYDEREAKRAFELLDYTYDHADLDFWLESDKGLAFFVDNEGAYVFNMGRAPEAQAAGGSSFDFAQLDGDVRFKRDTTFKLLLLNADFFAVLDGNDEELRFEEFPEDVKHYFAETFPEFDGCLTPQDYYSLEDHMPPYHGWKSRNDVKQEEAEKFFRYVDKVMNDEIVKDETSIPVILVTAPEHLHAFREVCTFKALYPKAIEKDPAGMTGEELRKAAVETLEG